MTHRYGSNMAAAVYGLIITGAILTASAGAKDPAGVLLAVLAVSLVLFWAAHVYSELLGEWASTGSAPGWARWRGEMGRQWPMVGAAAVPAALLLGGALDLMSDPTAIGSALIACTAELALAGFVAARRGGGGMVASIASAVVALGFGVTLMVLKALIH